MFKLILAMVFQPLTD